MTLNFENVYINETATITGPYEAKGPLKNYFDYSYNDLYFNQKTWELAEIKSQKDAIEMLLSKSMTNRKQIKTIIGGDLLNQIVATNYMAKSYDTSLIGIYAACATSTLGLIISALLIENTNGKVITITSSHNNAAEKQFRYPVEYGGPKPKTSTFTSTGSAAALITNEKKGIKIESGTIGKVIDSNIKYVYHMGAVMAKAAAETIYNHLKDKKREIDYYDLVLTGDLGIYGKQILKTYIKEKYNITLDKYEDTGVLLYNLKKVGAGASGPACAPLVTYSYIFKKMKNKEITKVLLIATGALMNQTLVNQKQTIPSVAHAVSLEAI